MSREKYISLRSMEKQRIEEIEVLLKELSEKKREVSAKNNYEDVLLCSLLDHYDAYILSKFISRVLVYDEKNMEVVFQGNDFIKTVGV